VVGQEQRCCRHLRNWARGISSAGGDIDGISGASVGAGHALTVSASLADTMIDTGYQILVASALENGGEHPDKIVLPLKQASSGIPASGTGYVQNLTETF
jgi:hypothetical protein